METFVTYQEPYWYVCTHVTHGQLWVRLRSDSEAHIQEGKEQLEKFLPAWQNWKFLDPSGIVKLNPFGHFIVPEAAQHINGRHFSNNRPIKSGPLSRSYNQRIKRG